MTALTLRPLPPPVHSVRPPRLFPVSRLGLGKACPLSLVMASAKGVDALPAHPRATYGTVLHRLLECAVRGEIDDGKGFSQGARQTLRHLLDALPEGTPPPGVVYGALGWRQKVADVVADAQMLSYRPSGAASFKLAVASASAPSSQRPANALLDGDGRWPEAWLESARLRVRGRADLVERRGSTVVVTDLKTGSAVKPGGEVDARVALQLQVYGLIVAEHVPSAQVELRVTSGSSVEVPFDTAERRAAMADLKGLAERLPHDQDVPSTALAKPGAACSHCAHRHRCSAYRMAAPQWWRDGADHPIPPDTWGRAETVAQGAADTLTLVVRDVADRRVRIARLRGTLAAGLCEGDRVFAFGLDRFKAHGNRGRHVAPLIYQDRDPDSETAAWSLAIFHEPIEVPDPRRVTHVGG